MAEIANGSVFSQTDGSNTGALPGLTGSSSPALIDNSIQALMGAIKREHDWRNFTVTSSGSANAYVLTYSVAPAAYYTGQRFGFITNFAVTGSATVNVNSLGAKTIKKMVAGVKTNLASGDIASGDFVSLAYDGTDMVWVNKGVATTPSGSILSSGYTMSTARLLGRTTASTGAPEEISVDSSLSLASTTLGMAGGVFGPYINGLNLAYTTATTYTVAVGSAANEDGGTAYNMRLSTAMVKSLSSWAAGNTNGSLDTGSAANNTWYHVHLIRKDSDGSIDVLLSTSPSAPTMPGGYTARRRLGSVRTNGSAQLTQWFQLGNEFLWNAAVVDIDATNPGTSAVTRTLTVPTGVQVFALINAGVYTGTTGGVGAVFSSLDVSDQAPQTGTTAALGSFNTITGQTGTSNWILAPHTVRTNTSAQIRSRISASGAADHVGIITRGWIDLRGQS